jgi:O-methyltransferase involved in polyketide biosynthesis
LRAQPSLRGILLDQPHVVEGARAAIAGAGLASRCEVVAGDFFKSVPAGDVFLLKQVLHDWNDEQCSALLKNCAASMKPGSRMLLVEMVIPDDRSASPAQLMDLNMLVMLPGRERTASEYGALLGKAGLQLKRVIATHSPFQIVEAGK